MATFAKRRDRVREEVLGELERMGLRKPRGRTEEAHRTWLRDLAIELVYLEPKHFGALVQSIRRAATGRDRDIWPSEAVILNLARPFCPYVGLSEIVGSYMRSAGGRLTWRRSEFEAHCLYRFLRDRGRPPGDRDWSDIQENARALAGEVDRAVKATAHPDQEVQWRARGYLMWWRRQRLWLARLIWSRLAEEREDQVIEAIARVDARLADELV